MPVVVPEYTITDKSLTEMESNVRAGLEDLTKYLPVDQNNRKVRSPGIQALMRVLDNYASLRQSYMGVRPKEPAEELAELQEDLRKNLEWSESHAKDPRTGQAAKESVRKGILRIEQRIRELNEDLGVLEPTANTAEPEPAF